MTSGQFSIPVSVQTGDLYYSRVNRFVEELKNYFISLLGFSFYAGIYETSQTDMRRYILVRNNVYTSIATTSNIGIDIRSGYVPRTDSPSWYRVDKSVHLFSISLPSSGSYSFSFWFANNFVFLAQMYPTRAMVCGLLKFNNIWCAAGYQGSYGFMFYTQDYFYIAPYRIYYTNANSANPDTITDVDDKHYLLQPIYARGLVPDSKTPIKIDDSIYYSGVVYTIPNSMGTVDEWVEYQDSEGNSYLKTPIGNYFFCD